MKIYKNVLNELTVEANDKKFYINKHINRYGKIAYTVTKQYPYYRSEIVLYDDVFLWISVEPFESWVKAYEFIKENINRL